jgi:catechol 2,3-dioxygenase-like lactoylglutathione lyase family enzyme
MGSAKKSGSETDFLLGNRSLTPIFSLALLALAVYATAAPVPEAERIPIDLRRTTLIVEDMDNSLAFYRDALGLNVVYDNMIRTPRSAATDAEAERALRLVFLQANDDFIGIIGLIEYVKPRKAPPAQPAKPFSIGSMVFVFNVGDLDARFAKASQTPGVTVLSEPEPTTYPSYDGTGTIPVRVSVLVDPDGYVIELNQLLIESVR